MADGNQGHLRDRITAAASRALSTVEAAAGSVHLGAPEEAKSAVTIAKPVEEVHAYWRDLQRLPTFMAHLESVTADADGTTHWAAKAPGGGTVEWDATIVDDTPPHRLSWTAVPGPGIDHAGSVEFRPAPGDRGTEVHVTLQSRVPLGGVGNAAAKLLGEHPQQQVHDDLRRFNRSSRRARCCVRTPPRTGPAPSTSSGSGRPFPRRRDMLAACWMGKEDVEVLDVPDPVLLNDRDAIVKVTSTAIYGSDLHLYHGSIPAMRKQDVLGHEFMGQVMEVGPGVHNLGPGDRVVVPFPIACGACTACRNELYSLCENSNPNAALAEKMLGHSPAGIFGYSHLPLVRWRPTTR